MLGNRKKNKWCCFCKSWYDPANTALKPRQGDLFDVDQKKRYRCMVHSYDTNALSTCPKFSPKF